MKWDSVDAFSGKYQRGIIIVLLEYEVFYISIEFVITTLTLLNM